MAKILTRQEMQQYYNGEWLLIAYISVDDQMRVMTGEVLKHSPNRDEIYNSLDLGKGQNIAIECFAPTPEDINFML
jgi:hypothetical protein